jgi:hypothetical protein
VHVRIDPAGDNEQAMRVEFGPPGHGAAELCYPAIPQADVTDAPVARSDNLPAPDDQVHHPSASRHASRIR